MNPSRNSGWNADVPPSAPGAGAVGLLPRCLGRRPELGFLKRGISVSSSCCDHRTGNPGRLEQRHGGRVRSRGRVSPPPSEPGWGEKRASTLLWTESAPAETRTVGRSAHTPHRVCLPTRVRQGYSFRSPILYPRTTMTIPGSASRTLPPALFLALGCSRLAVRSIRRHTPDAAPDSSQYPRSRSGWHGGDAGLRRPHRTLLPDVREGG